MSELAIQFTDEVPTPAALSVVAPPPPVIAVQPAQPDDLPEFEKAKVAVSEIRIAGNVAIDTHGHLSVSLDDIIRATGVFKVTKVNHFVNKAGDVVRQQVLTPVEDLDVTPWDAGNVNDNGIVRARP